MAYHKIEEILEIHKGVKQRIDQIENTLAWLKSDQYMPDIGDLKDRTNGNKPAYARLTIPTSFLSGVEEFDIPLETVEEILTQRLKDLKKDFVKIDHKVQKWMKEAS